MTEINVTNEINENKKLKKSTLFLILFFISNIIFPCWALLPLIVTFATFGITFIFGFIAFIALVFAIVFHRKYKSKGKFKIGFTVSTIVSICCVFIVFVSPWICINFEKNKLIYPIKKSVYSIGVRLDSVGHFPFLLPKECENYHFRTETCIHHPDYTECAYLSFYTNNDGIAKLEEKCREKGGYTTEAEMTYSEYIADLEFTESELNDKELMLSYKRKYLESLKFSLYVFDHLNKEKQNELDENLVVYRFKNKRHGYAFDYDSGLVVVWG
ncbi:MAG: hypothetical protein IJN43_15335 [Ruminococcus sp.]|nr:hypothetical protein [Ruminococcus sp.]